MVDYLIRLFESTDLDFTTNGLGTLSEAIKCEVVEQKNGEFELMMEYPITGRNYDLIEFRRIIVTKSNPYSDPQPFRIYSISKPISGIVTINAAHISYDLSGYPVAPFSASNISSAFTNMVNACAVTCPFTFWTDKSTAVHMETTVPASIRSVLGGMEGSILDTYRGEYEFDGLTVKLYNNRGTNRGVSIRYGKNMTDLQQDENCSNVYTAVYPYWYSEENGLVELDEKLVPADGTFDYVRVMTLDLTDRFQEMPTKEELLAAAQNYISSHNIGIPEVSLTVSFVRLTESEEYADYALLEEVRLCDTLNIEFPKLGVSATAQCIETTYNVLTGRYDSIELGTATADLVTTITEQKKAIQSVPTRTALEQAVLDATNRITGHNGGYVVLNPADSPSEILILDAPDISQAVNVWRWNGGGLGYSSNGYNGPYELAITMDGEINADFITAGTINGTLIEAGTIGSTAISQYYREEVTNEIGEAMGAVEQAFVAADALLRSTISETVQTLSGSIDITNENVSTLQQTVNELNVSFGSRVTGGINLIRNSSGLNGVSDDWTYTGQVYAEQTPDAVNNTLSGSMFRLRSGTLSQEIPVIRGKNYTLTLKASKNTSSRCYVFIDNGENDIYVFDERNVTGWTEYSTTFVASGDTITITAGTTSYYFYISDLMLVEGVQKNNWTPAPNEMYTTNVKIDRRGINITNSESSTETIIDNTQFAVKHQGNVVLTVNKDLTTLQKTEVLDELTVGKGRFVPKSNGLNFVLLD